MAKSVLFKQALQKRSEKRRSKKKLLAIGAAIIAVISFGIYYFSAENPQKITEVKPKLNIEFNIDTRDKVSGDLIKSMNFKLQKWWQNDSDLSMRKLAEKTQKEFSFERVHLLKVAPNHIVVSVALRNPVMIVDLNQPKFVSESGAVYGLADRLNSPKLPFLTGVFNKSTKRQVINRDGTLFVSKDEADSIATALEVYEEAKKAGFETAQLKFEKFRGYEVVLKPTGLEVFLGFNNYRKKFLRLKKLNTSLEKSGSQAARIELDYSDKAFIKRKM